MSKPQLSVVHSIMDRDKNINDTRTAGMSKPDPVSVIFCQLLLSLFQHIDHEQRGLGLKTKVFLYDRLGQMMLPGFIRDAFRNYLLTNRPLNLQARLDEAVMREIVQMLYEKMCSLFGPVNADICLNRAMADTERLPEARFFSPRELL